MQSGVAVILHRLKNQRYGMKNLLGSNVILRFGAQNMKSLQLYVCDHCGTQYKDKNECKQCESNHKSALEIHDMRFHASKESINYPDKVELKMADGKMIWYHR